MKEYEIIQKALDMLNAIPKSAASEKTINDYKEIFNRLLKLAKVGATTEAEVLAKIIVCAKDTMSSNTWYSRRAALIHCFRCLLECALREQSIARRTLLESGVSLDSLGAAHWRRLAGRAGVWGHWLSVAKDERPPYERTRRHSKRQDMRGLPTEWQGRVLRRCPTYHHALLVNAVTGCRPAELARGIRLSIEEHFLIADIEGVKVTAYSGQPWRRLAWPIDSESPLVRELTKEVLNGLREVRIECPKRYSGAVSAAARREWPTRKKSITPYCFRHQVASNMKAAGVDGAVISMALGHCADRTRSRYGSSQQGRRGGAMVPVRVEAPREVRQTKGFSCNPIDDLQDVEMP